MLDRQQRHTEVWGNLKDSQLNIETLTKKLNSEIEKSKEYQTALNVANYKLEQAVSKKDLLEMQIKDLELDSTTEIENLKGFI